LHRVPVFKRVWLYLAIVALYTIAVDLLPLHLNIQIFKDAGSAGAAGGLILGILLVFRTNSSYERWWEGRKLWRQLTNDSRNLCLKVRALTSVSKEEAGAFGQLIISFAYALKHHLRNTKPVEPLPGVDNVSALQSKNLPLHVSKLIYDAVGSWRQSGKINEMTLLILDQHTRALMDICGSCERIKNSPLSISYRAFMRQGIGLNLLVWPWYLTHEFPLVLSLPPILIGAYFLIGIELIAEDVEEPFGKDGDDLPLDDLCQGIKESVGSLVEVPEKMKFTVSIQKPRVDFLKETGHF